MHYLARMDFTIPQVVGIIGISIAVLFATMILYDIIKKIVIKKKTKDNSEISGPSLDIRVLIYMNLLMILIHIVSSTISSILSTIDIHCKLYCAVSVASFYGSRSMLYMVLVRRMIVISDDTIIGLSIIQKYTLYIFVALYSIPYILYINWRAIEFKYYEEYGCLIQYTPHLLHYTSSVLHIVIITYSLYLFIRPLHHLIKLQESHNISYQLYCVMIKYCILHCSSMCSCIVLMIVSYLYPFGYNYSMIDAFINGAILILLHPIHNKLYKTLCCIFHSLCVKHCIKQDEALRSSSAISYQSSSVIPRIATDTLPAAPTETEMDVIVETKTETEHSKLKITIDNIGIKRVKSTSPMSSDSQKENGERESAMDAQNENEEEYDRTASLKSQTLSPRTSRQLTASTSEENSIDLDRRATNTIVLIRFESYAL